MLAAAQCVAAYDRATGRVAQWESARFTRERSLVRNQPRPSSKCLLSEWFSAACGDKGPVENLGEIDFLPVSARKSPADLVVAAGVVGLLHSVRPNQDAHLRSGVVALKVERKKASEHPAFGKTEMIMVPSLPKRPKKPKRPKR